MPETKIQTMIDRNGNTILPRTRIEAVYLEDGQTTIQDRLDTIDNTLANLSADAADITATPAGNISATNVQDALEELDVEKASSTFAIAMAIALS